MAKIFPDNIQQDPYPIIENGLEYSKTIDTNSLYILEEFKKILPDSYKSGVNGPYYINQFKAISDELSRLQISLQEILGDSDFSLIRSEFLYKMVGSLIFKSKDGIPNINGDISYREFLVELIKLIMNGSRRDSMESAIELLTDSTVSVIENALEHGRTSEDFRNQFSFNVDIVTDGGTRFPVDALVLEENVSILLKVIKPAHTIYRYRNVFIDAFGFIFGENLSSEDVEGFRYDDARVYCDGIKNIVSSNGETLSNRFFFSDVSVSFDNIIKNSVLEIISGTNKGMYRVDEILAFPNTDSTEVSFEAHPSGLSGKLVVDNESCAHSVLDPSWPFLPKPDFSVFVEGEVISILEGSNTGSYRIKEFIGENGCPITGTPSGPVYDIRVSKCLLKLKTRMPSQLSGQSYRLEVDRLGIKETKVVVGEDVSSQFYL
jgi:hypothetical protein